MKKTVRTTVVIFLTLIVTLALPLAMSSSATQASGDNQVNLDFYDAYIHMASGDSVDITPLSADALITYAEIHNVPDGSGSNVANPVLHFEAGVTDTVVQVDDRDLRVGPIHPDYYWDLPTIEQHQGQSRNVMIDPVGVDFVPGFGASLSFSIDGTPIDPFSFTESCDFDLQINTDTSSSASMGELQVTVEIPYDPLVNATIVGWSGDGDFYPSPEGNNLDIHIPGPTTSHTYIQNITIHVELVDGVGSAGFKPSVGVIAWEHEGGDNGPDTSVSVSSDFGTLTWDTGPEPYWWYWNQRTAKAIIFTAIQNGPVNQVHANFETGQTLNVEGDAVDNVSTEGWKWLNFNLHNEGDETHGAMEGFPPFGGPLLTLDVEPLPGEFGPPDFVIGPGLWGFPVIGENEGQHAHANYGLEPFQPGFSAERTADQPILPSGGGTQVLTIVVIPEEPMNVLSVNGDAQTSDKINAHIVDVQLNFPEGCEWGGGFEPGGSGFGFEVFNPDPFEMYEWQITIDVNPVEDTPPVEIEYMPFVQVRNMARINGQHYGSSLSGDIPSGSWNWEAEGDYLWNWTNNQVREANFNGYANFLFDISEQHFNLSNSGLRLFEDEYIPEVSDSIQGNLFTFTQFQTPSHAQITSWSHEIELSKSKKHEGKLEIFGTFTIDVGDMWYDFGVINGTIDVSFEGECFSVEDPFGSEEVLRYNFEADFEIVSGTGFYDGLGGSGTIAGTLHDYPWDPGHPEYSPPELQEWFDFVLIGEAEFD